MKRRTFLSLGSFAATLLLTGDHATTGTPLSKRMFGCYYPAAAGTYNFADVETQVGVTFNWYSTFMSFDSSVARHPEITVAAKLHGIVIAFAPATTRGLNFADILAAKYDAFLTTWFTYLAALPNKVVIRWAWEMNGSWMQYSPVYTGQASSNCTSVEQYIEVWRYVVSLQRKTGGTNIRWFFCANQADSSGCPRLESFYPGSDYVDIVGYDSYNSLNGIWMSPLRTLAGYPNMTGQRTAYARVSKLHPTAEIWVGELGCVEPGDPMDHPPIATGRSKPAFWKQFFAVTGLPRLSTVLFFDSHGTRDWRFDTSPESLAAFRKGFAGVR